MQYYCFLCCAAFTWLHSVSIRNLCLVYALNAIHVFAVHYGAIYPGGYRSKRSSSSQSFLLVITILPPLPPPPCSAFSVIAPSISFNCSSFTLLLSCPDLASIMSLFSTSVALDSLTSRIRPRRSAASGVRTWERIDVRASASCCL